MCVCELLVEPWCGVRIELIVVGRLPKKTFHKHRCDHSCALKEKKKNYFLLPLLRYQSYQISPSSVNINKSLFQLISSHNVQSPILGHSVEMRSKLSLFHLSRHFPGWQSFEVEFSCKIIALQLLLLGGWMHGCFGDMNSNLDRTFF